MEKLINFSKKHNLLDLFFIFIFLSILFFLFYGKLGSYLVDCGREAYLPWQMNNGQVLYKDLFNMYGPLGYQINALLFKIFGTNLNTLYFAGYFNSLIISGLVYYITKIFVDRKTALYLVCVVATVCIFSSGLFNFIFPYSYNAVYALTSVLVSVYTILLYLGNRNKILLNISFLFAGFSFANKIEYLPYFCFLFVCLPFLLKKDGMWSKNLKEYLMPIVAFGLFPIISFGVLLFQGASVSDFLNAATLINNVLNAPSTEYYYYNYGLFSSKFHVWISMGIFLRVLKYTLLLFVCLYLIHFLGEKFLQNNKIKIVFNTSIIILLLLITKIIYQWVSKFYTEFFSWLGLFAFCVLLGFIIYYLIKLISKNFNLLSISKFDLSFIILLLSSILLSFKGFAAINLELYGTFSFVLLFLVFVIFVMFYIPKMIKVIDNNIWVKIIHNLLFITICLFLVINAKTLFEKTSYPIKTQNGVIIGAKYLKSQQKLLNFIKNNTDKDSVLVSVPEGAMINFLTQRKGHSLYYYLIPGNIQAFGEDKIVADFEKNPPDYFLVNNFSYPFYNVTIFPKFAPKIFDFIDKNYNQIFYVDDDLLFVLYKKKPVLK